MLTVKWKVCMVFFPLMKAKNKTPHPQTRPGAPPPRMRSTIHAVPQCHLCLSKSVAMAVLIGCPSFGNPLSFTPHPQFRPQNPAPNLEVWQTPLGWVWSSGISVCQRWHNTGFAMYCMILHAPCSQSALGVFHTFCMRFHIWSGYHSWGQMCPCV